MEIGVSPHPLGPRHPGDFGDVLEVARLAEALGFQHVFAAGHVLAGDAGLTMDPMVLLSAVAGATSRVELLTSVVVLPLYNPVVLANQASTLDAISAGRLVLGVGTGWDTAEYAAVGVPFAERGARADEQLEVLRALWADMPADFHGRFTSLRQATIGVPPGTPGGPRVWVGGHSDAALRRALRFADAWHGSIVDVTGATEVGRRLEALGDEVGRDPATLRLTAGQFIAPPGIPQAQPVSGRPLGGTTPTAASVIDELGALGEAGVSACSVWMPVAPEHLPDGMRWLADEVLPHV